MKSHSVRIVTSSVRDGNMSPRWGDAKVAADNRVAFLERNGLSTQLVMLSVPTPNGATIETVESGFAGTIVADALTTEAPGLVLGLYTADCLPVVMFDAERGIVGLAHCGWQSTGARLAEALIDALVARGAHASDIAVTIGPSIKKTSYIQLRERVAQIGEPAWAPFLERHDDRYFIDLHSFVTAQCCGRGVAPEHIIVSAQDSYADPTCFSHRRSVEKKQPEGRMLTVVSLMASGQ